MGSRSGIVFLGPDKRHCLFFGQSSEFQLLFIQFNDI